MPRADLRNAGLLESRMLGNLHVRFGVGVEVELLGLHHLLKEMGRGD